MSKATMQKEWLSISEVKSNPENPRHINADKYAKLMQSISEMPEMLEVRPLVVNMNNVVLGGNMRLKAMQEAGAEKVPVIRVDWPEDKQRAFIIKDNVGYGDWDWEVLASQWDADDLESWGLDLWQEEEKEVQGLTDEDEVPEIAQEANTKPGDVYALGDHRLMCGDSTNAAHLEILMQGEAASFAIADPPYNVGYSYETYDDNLTHGDYAKFCHSYTDNALTHSPAMAITPGKSNEKLYTDRGDFCEYLTWYKGFGLSRGSWYKAMVTEPILLHGKKPKNKFYPTDHIEQGTDRIKGLGDKHTCPKPVELWRRIIEPMTEVGDIVLEMFGGSGTTAIVCEKIGRKGRLMEIDPIYCDLIVKRWEDFTGQKATKLIDTNGHTKRGDGAST